MGKGYNNYMTKKPFHPGSKANIKRTWMAEQRAENEKKKQEELKTQYEKEQDLYNNRALLSTESKDKLELNFMYEAPPGAKRERQKEDDEPEYKFEWQRKYNAPREDYAKGNADIRDQPFGIPVRNVRCIKCHKWGHINTDKDCPLYSHTSTSSMPTTSMDPLELMRQMREDGYNLKQSVLGHHLDPKHSNQQFIPSDEESDPEMDFLKSLSSKQKRKLLKKLNKLSKKQKKKDDAKRKKIKKKNKSRRSESSDPEDDVEHRQQSKGKSSGDDESDDSGSEEVESERKNKKKSKTSHPVSKPLKQDSSKSLLRKAKKQRESVSGDSCSEKEICDNTNSRKKHKKKDKKRDKSLVQMKEVTGHHKKGKKRSKHEPEESCDNTESDCSPPKWPRVSEAKEKKNAHSKKENEEQRTHEMAVAKSMEKAKDAEHKKKTKNKDEERTVLEKDKNTVEKKKNHSLKGGDVQIHQQRSTDDSSHDTASKDDSHEPNTSWSVQHKKKCYSSSEEATVEKQCKKTKDHLSKNQSKEEENEGSVTSSGSNSKVSPSHPDGFDHEFPQRLEGIESLNHSKKYKGLGHDRYRNLHRHRRSPSVKHKYRS